MAEFPLQRPKISSPSENNQLNTPPFSESDFSTPGSDFFRATIPRDLSTNVPAPASPSVFYGLSETAKYTQMRGQSPLKFGINLNSSAIYDDNVSLTKTGKRHAIQMGIGPSASLRLGSDASAFRLGANYSGMVSAFSDRPQERTFDQIVGVGSEWGRKRLHVSVSAAVQSSHENSLDVGGRSERRVFYAGSTASYEVSGKTSAHLSADVAKSNVNTLLSSTEYRTQEFLNYQWSPKLLWGFGTTQGAVNSENAAKQHYIQGNIRAAARVTDKLNFSVSAGNEWRHYDSGQTNSTTPVFRASAVWQATGKTTFTLDTRRSIFASASLASQNYESTSTTLSAHEMLSANMEASLSLGVEKAHYSASSPGIQSDREDNYRFSRIALEWLLNRNWTFATFFEAGTNDSTGTQAQSFRRNRMGLSLNFSF